MLHEWFHPDGSVVKWRPLTVKEMMDTEGAFGRPEQTTMKLLQSVLLRVQEYGGKPRTPAAPPLALKDIQGWDNLVLEDFLAHIQMTEEALRAGFKKKQAEGHGAVMALEASIEQAQVSLNQVAVVLATVLEQAKAIEAEQLRGPLEVSST